jgi:(4-(4-[2-(gamma-L-glutamylamino)ethyl]phenoxymethyl)furan-2-yl)methanamine synthase
MIRASCVTQSLEIRDVEAAVEGRPDQHAVTPRISKLFEIGRAANPAAGQQVAVRQFGADGPQEIDVGTGRPADTTEVEHEHGTGARVRRAPRQRHRRLPLERGARSCHGMTEADVETEYDVRSTHLADDRGQIPERCQCLEPDNHPLDALVADAARGVDRRGARVHHQRQSRREYAAQIVRRWRVTGNRVEIGDIYFCQPDPVAIGPRQGDRVPRPLGRHERAPHGFVRVSPPAPRMDGFSGLEIDDADDAHASNMPAHGVIGWDVGGANTKVARVGPSTRDQGDGDTARAPVAAAVRAYEIQRDPGALSGVLAALARQVGAHDGDAHALTMTAELSQCFRTKREGVAFVLDAVAAAFPGAAVHVYSVRGAFLSSAAARTAPLAVAAANWVATATAVAHLIGDAILVDIGTTTTDIIPIVGGAVAAMGWTDPDRLASGELLYLGAVRTPVEAIMQSVPLGAGFAGVSAEAFAVTGDVHLWRGTLAADAYTASTPDGRPATRIFAGERLARVVCADREMIDAPALDRIADAVAATQIERTAAAIARVRARHPGIETAVVAGTGDFLAAAAAHRAGMTVRWLADNFGPDGARAAPASAVAVLLALEIASRHPV